MSNRRISQKKNNEKTGSAGKNKIHTYYEIKEGSLIRKNKKCPRCGAFMAHHRDPIERWACGACSYTEYTIGK